MTSDQHPETDPDLIADGKRIWDDLQPAERSALTMFLTPAIDQLYEEGARVWDDLMPHERQAVQAFRESEGARIRELLPSEPEGTWQTLLHHWPKWGLVLLIIGAILLYAILGPKTEQKAVEYSAVPLKITHVEADVNKTKTSRGYKIVTPNWIVVTDVRTTYNPEGTCPPLSKVELAASQNLAAHCEVAKQRNEPVIIFGVPAKEGDGQPRMLDGEPVLLARKIVYAGREFILYPE